MRQEKGNSVCLGKHLLWPECRAKHVLVLQMQTQDQKKKKGRLGCSRVPNTATKLRCLCRIHELPPVQCLCNISACINHDLFVCAAFLWLILSLLTRPQDPLRSAQSAADVLLLGSDVPILHFIGNRTPPLVPRPLHLSFTPLLCCTVCYARARTVSCQ